jgi:hypothetical protein
LRDTITPSSPRKRRRILVVTLSSAVFAVKNGEHLQDDRAIPGSRIIALAPPFTNL